MLVINPWEQQSQIKTLYSECVDPICKKYHIARMELDILLFLFNNPEYDTAAEIVEVRYLTKSHVSTSIKHLVEAGYVRKEYTSDNHKVGHLVICEKADDLIKDGKNAEDKFVSILFEGLTKEEWMAMERGFVKLEANIKRYMIGRNKTKEEMDKQDGSEI